MSKLISKKEKFKQLIKNDCLFTCPICKKELILNDDSLQCENYHTFDINKKGYVHLLKKQKKFKNNIYTKSLFLNRRIVILNNLYDRLHSYIANFINKSVKNEINIFEVGSGESTHAYMIKNKLKIKNRYIVSDISDTAVELSTDYLNSNIIPIVCDAYNLPLQDNTIDFIIDILSPYYYKEINRILKNDGYFIKIFPNKNYLVELRSLINIKEYSKQDEVFNNFDSKFKIVQLTTLNYTVTLSEPLASAVYKMTPMTNNHICSNNIDKITIALDIVIAKKIIKV